MQLYNKLLTTEVEVFTKTITLFDLILFIAVILLLPAVFFVETPLVGILGLALGIVGSYRWRLKSSLMVGVWLDLVLVLGVIIDSASSYYAIDSLVYLITIVLICLVSNRISHFLKKRRDELITENQELKQQNKELKALFKNSRMGVVKINKDNEIIESNNKFTRLFDYSLEEIKGKDLDKVLNKGESRTNCELTNKVLEGEEVKVEGVCFDKGDNPVEVLAKRIPIKKEGKVEDSYIVYEDIGGYKEMGRTLRKQKSLLNSVLESIQAGISVLDEDLKIQYANDKMKDWMQDNLPIKGKKCFEAYCNREQSCPDCPSIRCIETGEVQKKIVEDHCTFPGEYMEIYSYPMKDELNEEVTGVVEVCRDVTARKKAEKKIEYISFHDELTDLYNRAYLESQMERLDTMRQLPMSIIMIDVNGLKLTNDTFGHQAGDRLLMKTAEILQESARNEDIIARFGGDEFTILLPQTKLEDARAIKERINNNCKKISNLEIPLSIALGVATKEREEQDLWEIRKEADANMYQNKLKDNEQVKAKIMKALISKLEAESAETAAHTLRMQKLSFQLGEKLGLSMHKLEALSSLATLHDIGKIVVDKEILTKPDTLTEEEWLEVKEHAKAGYRITSSTDEFAHIAKEILNHHEHWDGSGYPEGLTEDEIPFLARIISIVDAYDVMISGRPYKEAMTEEEAKEELQREAGKQFDPELVEEFLEVI